MKYLFIKVDSILSKFSFSRIILVALLIVALISIVDLVSGYEISISIFFLIPVAITTWYGGHRTGIFFCFLSAIMWFLIDYFGHAYSLAAAPYWNGLVRLGFFLITEGLLNQIKAHLHIEKMLSRTDDLTNLLNVRGFAEQVGKLFAVATRHSRPVVIAYIDVDNFKKVNDEFGHSEGDKVLQVVGNIISSSLRTTDVAGRLGGDEFAIVLPETDQAGAKSVFDTLRGALLQETQQHNWPISFSIGAVSFDAPSASLDEAIKIADSLMYQVKASGKNNIIILHNPAT